jgi:alkylated DNA repair dioxygenase AlkB
MYQGFTEERLDEANCFFRGHLPEEIVAGTQFDALWQLHPEEFHEIMMHGKLVKTPRWQQAYGKDYHYTSRTNVALPIDSRLQPLLDWGRGAVDARLNGVLVNWYDGRLNHYIGRHRDSTANMIVGTPIVTISLGEERIFRLRRWREQVKGEEAVDFPATNGAAFVMPYETNLHWTHEVPRRARNRGRRISVTLRGFM